jgi:transcription antitermination factor NusG
MTDLRKNWYILYTKAGCEKKVANLLLRKNIENYCPLRRQCNNGKKRVVLEVLFTSYVFIKIDEAEMASVRKIDNVVNFVYWLGKPAMITQEEVEIMNRFLNEYSNLKLEKIPFGQQLIVREKEGYAANKPHMVTVKNNTVKITLPSLGYMIVADIEKPAMEIIASSNQSVTIINKYQFAV